MNIIDLMNTKASYIIVLLAIFGAVFTAGGTALTVMTGIAVTGLIYNCTYGEVVRKRKEAAKAEKEEK